MTMSSAPMMPLSKMGAPVPVSSGGDCPEHARLAMAREVERLEEQIRRIRSGAGSQAYSMEEFWELEDTLRLQVAQLHAFDEAKAAGFSHACQRNDTHKHAHGHQQGSHCSLDENTVVSNFALLYGGGQPTVIDTVSLSAQTTPSSKGDAGNCWDQFYGGQVTADPTGLAGDFSRLATESSRASGTGGGVVPTSQQTFHEIKFELPHHVDQQIQLDPANFDYSTQAMHSTQHGLVDQKPMPSVDAAAVMPQRLLCHKPENFHFNSQPSFHQACHSPRAPCSEAMNENRVGDPNGHNQRHDLHMQPGTMPMVQPPAAPPGGLALCWGAGMLAMRSPALDLHHSVHPGAYAHMYSMKGDNHGQKRCDGPGTERSCLSIAGSSAASCLLTAAEKKKATRTATKELIATLDSLLPPISPDASTDTCKQTLHSCAQALLSAGNMRRCGSRALGNTGRSLLAILEDAAKLVKSKQQQQQSHECSHNGNGVVQHHHLVGHSLGTQARGLKGKHARAGAKSSSSKVRSRKNSASGAAELVLGGCNGNGLDEGMQQADTRVSPEIYKFAMLSGQSMLTIDVTFPTCGIREVGAGFLRVIKERVGLLGEDNQACSSAQLVEMIKDLTLYQFLHPDDVHLLWGFVLGRYWTYGSVSHDSHPLRLRLAPPQPSLSPYGYTPTAQQDIYIQLVALDPSSGKGIFSGEI